MFKLKTTKTDGVTNCEIIGQYSIAQIDIAFKDICIFFIGLKRIEETFKEKSNGYLEIEVTQNIAERTDDENALIEMMMLPRNQVSISSDGYSLLDIQYILKAIQDQIKIKYKPNFMYNVDFIKLSAE